MNNQDILHPDQISLRGSISLMFLGLYFINLFNIPQVIEQSLFLFTFGFYFFFILLRLILDWSACQDESGFLEVSQTFSKKSFFMGIKRNFVLGDWSRQVFIRRKFLNETSSSFSNKKGVWFDGKRVGRRVTQVNTKIYSLVETLTPPIFFLSLNNWTWIFFLKKKYLQVPQYSSTNIDANLTWGFSPLILFHKSSLSDPLYLWRTFFNILCSCSPSTQDTDPNWAPRFAQRPGEDRFAGLLRHPDEKWRDRRKKRERGNTKCDAFNSRHNLWSIIKVHSFATCGFLNNMILVYFPSSRNEETEEERRGKHRMRRF